MTSQGFSNTSTGDAPADPYKAKNKDDDPSSVSLEDKIGTLSSFVKACKFGMMTTWKKGDNLLASRCMAVAAQVCQPFPRHLYSMYSPVSWTAKFQDWDRSSRFVLSLLCDSQESGGMDLIFHTNTESGKTDDLADDPTVNMSFLNATGEWASISGSSEIITDRDMVKKYYSPALKAWVGDLGDGKHDGGPDDPRIGVIRVRARTITYAVNRGNFVSRGVEMVQGAVTGSTPQVNRLREVNEEECTKWRAQHS